MGTKEIEANRKKYSGAESIDFLKYKGKSKNKHPSTSKNPNFIIQIVLFAILLVIVMELLFSRTIDILAILIFIGIYLLYKNKSK